MSRNDLDRRRTSSQFTVSEKAAARLTQLGIWISGLTILIEVAAGCFYNSMALIADGFHLIPQAVAIGSSASALAAARRRVATERVVSFTRKVAIPVPFAGGVFLLAMAALLMLGSLERVFEPRPIHYKQAIVVASIALVVNTISALLLELAQHRPRVGDQGHASFGNVASIDFSSQSFYMNVIADVATSFLALTALIGGGIYGLTRMDPVAGALGALVIGLWAKRFLTGIREALLEPQIVRDQN
jgi:cation diffusion facilitator family transporter